MNEEMIEQIANKVEERIKYRIVRSIIEALEEHFYPPENSFREEFIKEVEIAEKEVREGKSKSLSTEEFKKEFVNIY
ncbi:MAG: hypothetical protein NZ879_05930 [Archaeoglobaceae archaeon]|nr:hypothetical protein [Archaeoglobaceae archaeon]MDW8118506.1 hypothetical protein [Archaeoglobaceae archaeon]